MFSDLAAEMIYAIGCKTTTADQKSLRAVSRQFRSIIEPIFCANASLSLKLELDSDTPSQLEILATGKTAWSHCQKLRIHSLACPAEKADQVRKSLRPALEALTNIRSVRLGLGKSDAPWAQATVIDVLNKTRRQLELDFVGNPEYTVPEIAERALAPISNLRSLSISALDVDWTPESGFTKWILQTVRASPQLESLYLVPASMGCCSDICRVLEEMNIRLKSVFVKYPTLQSLPRYLASYSGLERLRLGVVWREAMGATLLNDILPRHVESLVELSLVGNAGEVCNFGQHNIALISQMTRLERLEMSFSPSTPAGLREAIELFLKTVATLPLIRDIALLPAHYHGTSCGGANEVQTCANGDRVTQILKDLGYPKESVLGRLIETHHVNTYSEFW
ncbi:hypothetical protein B0H16DRAFT_104926 [Mycena metata]|uniref:F-box domain-containing protein n=1 Tax=Mycena metata TaxID=1033252 RepID=A0AAD7I957_9AGAR|nr:hypothetical protein B0H16DRAFT_104926 [Mycena metata]